MISISTIFQSETTALESQVAALQAQIAAHTERISLLNETELLAGDSLEALKGAIQKVTALAPDAIASLKSAVLDLFRGDSSDDGGNLPINPAPQPNDDGGEPEEPKEPLNGQLCELSSPYCQLLEDAAHIKLDTACTVGTPESEPEQLPSANNCSQFSNPLLVSDVLEAEQLPHVELVPVTHLVAYQRRSTDGEIICAYLAGNNKSRLKDWGSWLCNQHSVGSGFELREAKRMTAYKWELKIWGMSLKQVVRLSETDTTKTPPSRYHIASMPVAAHLLQADEVSAPAPAQVAEVTDRDVEEIPATVIKLEQDTLPDPQGFQVGDRVEVTSDRHGAELVGQSGIVTAATKSGAAVDVNNTLRYFCVDELAAISTPVSAASLEPTEDEKVAIASIQPPAYNPYPIGRRGAAANFEAYQAAKAVEREQKALAAFTPEDEPDF